MLRVGQLVFIIASGEATTMSGRRWRDAVGKGMVDQGLLDSSETPWVVLGGPANTYAHYVRYIHPFMEYSVSENSQYGGDTKHYLDIDCHS